MISLRLPENIEKELEELIKETGVTKSAVVKEALRAYLNEVRGYYIALQRLHDKDAKYYTTEELKKELGLD
jgi:RHH-type rel operon transcriptional repressor/antitoxin RelB